MNDSKLKSGTIEDDLNQADWNVDTIAEQIFVDLNGSVTRSAIQEVLKEVVPKYVNARIQTFVPIFIRQETEKRLRAMQTVPDPEDMGILETEAREESQANLDPSPRRIAPDEQDRKLALA